VTTQTVQLTSSVVMPQVNLMPPEIAEAQRLHRLQRGMAGAVLLSAIAVGGLYWHAKQGVSSAQSELAANQAQHASLQTKYNGLNDVQQVFTAVQAKQDLVQRAMSQEIRWSFMLNDLTTRVPDNVWVTGVIAAETTAPGSTAAPAVSGSVPSIGTLSFSGVAFHHDDVANWLDSMAKVKGFADPTFSTSVKAPIGNRIVVNFSSSVNLSTNALSNRYTTRTGN
jgi:Tfp pilus assembly protein PilN